MSSQPDERQWTVTWTIEEWAATPEEAARKARAAQIHPSSLATVFDVREVVEPGSLDERRLVSYRVDVAEAPLPQKRLVPQRATCPECGSPVRHYFRANPMDPGDVDPAADCTNAACGWGY